MGTYDEYLLAILASESGTRIVDGMYPLDSEDLDCLVKPGTFGWINNYVINALARIYQQDALPNVHVFPVEFAKRVDGSRSVDDLHGDLGLSLWLGNPPNDRWPQYSALREMPFNLEEKTVWVIPLHDAMHWTLGLVDFQARELVFMDPLGETESSQRTWARILLEDMVQHALWAVGLPLIQFETWTWRQVIPSIPQRDGTSCGLYVLRGIRQVCIGESLGQFKKFTPREERMVALYQLLSQPLRAQLQADPELRRPEGPMAQSATARTTHATAVPLLPDLIVLADLESPDGPPGSSSQPIPPLRSQAALPKAAKPAVPTKPPKGCKRKAEAQPAKTILPTKVSHEVHDVHSSERPRKRARVLGPKKVKRRTEKNLTVDERIAILKADPNLSAFSEMTFTCACRPRIPHHLGSWYNLENYYTHLKSCPVEKSKLKGQKTLEHFIKLSAPKSVVSVPCPTSVTSIPADAKPKGWKMPRLPERFSEHRCTGLGRRGDDRWASLARDRGNGALGGVSIVQYPGIQQRLFPYKEILPSHKATGTVPTDGNRKTERNSFTAAEKELFELELQSLSVWIVDESVIRSTACTARTMNVDEICDKCKSLTKSKHHRAIANKAAINENEPLEVKAVRLGRKDKFTPSSIQAMKTQPILRKLAAAEWGSLVEALKNRGMPGAIFVKMAHLVRTGKISPVKEIEDVLSILVEKWERAQDPNPKLKHGIRYPMSLINLGILCKTAGGAAAQQYNILSGIFQLPTLKSIRRNISGRGESLGTPYLSCGNIENAKALIAQTGWTGPLALATDCTKLKPRCSFINDFVKADSKDSIGHVVGLLLPFEDCAVSDESDIERVTSTAESIGGLAPYMRVTILKVPFPGVPPIVVAAYPTNNDEKGPQITTHLLKAQALCEEAGIRLITSSADGHNAERNGQKGLANSEKAIGRLEYANPTYGVSLSAPIFATGPLITPPDTKHNIKTYRNNTLSGTHTIAVGNSVTTFSQVAELYDIGSELAETASRRGEPPVQVLKMGDIGRGMDKQDDGAARRFLHAHTLAAMTEPRSEPKKEDDGFKIREGFECFFVLSFVLGELSDAWLNRSLGHMDRLIMAFRAILFLGIVEAELSLKCANFPDFFKRRESFLSLQSREIFFASARALILLILAHAEHYPDIPLCPWEHGTEALEHLFGVARQMLEDFTYAEYIQHAKAISLRSALLFTGHYSQKKEKQSKTGAVYDFDQAKLTPEILRTLSTFPDRAQIDQACSRAWEDIATICHDVLGIPVPTLPLSFEVFEKVTGAEEEDMPDADENNEDAQDLPAETVSLQPALIATRLPYNPSEQVSHASMDTARLDLLASELDEERVLSASREHSVPTAHAVSPETTSAPTAQMVVRPTVRNLIHVADGPASMLLNGRDSTVNIAKILNHRLRTQSGTNIRSEKILSVSARLQAYLPGSILSPAPSDLGEPNSALTSSTSMDPETRPTTQFGKKENEDPLNFNELHSLLRHKVRETPSLVSVNQSRREIGWTTKLVTEADVALPTIAQMLGEDSPSNDCTKATVKPSVTTGKRKRSNKDGDNRVDLAAITGTNLINANVSETSPLRCYEGRKTNRKSIIVAYNGDSLFLGVVEAIYRLEGGRHAWKPQVTSMEGVSYLSLRVYIPGRPTRSDANEFTHTVEHSLAPGSHWNLFTHLPASKLVYNLDTAHLIPSKDSTIFQLDAASHLIWKNLYTPAVRNRILDTPNANANARKKAKLDAKLPSNTSKVGELRLSDRSEQADQSKQTKGSSEKSSGGRTSTTRKSFAQSLLPFAAKPKR